MPRSPFYNSSAWKKLRRMKLARSPLCEECRRPATDVDHKVSIHKGGHPLDMTNLQSLCHSCHSRKTMELDVMKRERMAAKGCTADGMPRDKQHWWGNGT